jgi:predicted NodU family carbamoyl transferase
LAGKGALVCKPALLRHFGRFTRKTDIPSLVNTSFNVHEEPIVNRPEECVRALSDGRIDFVVTKRALYHRGGVAHRLAPRGCV